MGKRVDLNSDLGEGFGNYRFENDEEIIKHISSANIAHENNLTISQPIKGYRGLCVLSVLKKPVFSFDFVFFFCSCKSLDIGR